MKAPDMTRIAALLALITLASCGASGYPTAPATPADAAATPTGVTLSGSATAGIATDGGDYLGRPSAPCGLHIGKNTPRGASAAKGECAAGHCARVHCARVHCPALAI
jgi:hypothetical protein